MDSILRRGFQLGDRRIYPLTGEVQGPNGSGHVKPKAMEVLLCLAQQQGDVVRRADIVRQVWGDMSVSDEVLTGCISELRHQLGDLSAKPRFIKTIPKRGYQLLPQIHPLGSQPPIDTDATNDTSPLAMLIENLRRRRVLRVVGAYAIVVWAGLQVADTIFSPLGVPDWVMPALVWAAAIGFPIVAILAWTLQVTDKGIVIDDSAILAIDHTRTLPGRSIDFAIIGILGLIIGFLVYDRLVERSVDSVIVTADGEIDLPKLTPDVVDPNSIAVLPFANLTPDPRMDYLAMGLAEEVLNLLANIRELKVPSRTSSFFYGDKDIDLASMAKQLRVKNVLEGSIQGQVDDLRISAQLIDAESGYHVWSQTFARRNTNALAVRDEIARAVVDSLKLVLSLESQNRILRRPTDSEDAYDYYLQGLGYLRRPRSAQNLDNAEALFRRALDLDPNYALAYAGLCDVHLGKYLFDQRTTHVAPAERACASALSNDPELAEVHAALGSLYRHTGQFHQSELSFQRAIVLNRKLEPAFYGIGRVYMAQDRLEEAEMIFRYAVDLEPGYWGTYLALGNFYLEFGRPAEAIAPFQRVTELNPDFAMGFNNLGAAYYNSGNVEFGEKAYLQSLQIGPTELALSNIGVMYYNTGRFDSATEMFRQATVISPHDYSLWGRLAAASRFVPGLKEEVPRNFGRAIELAEAQLATNPNDARTLAFIASYYANVADEENARSAIIRALEIGPNDPHVHYFAAQVSAILGNDENAISALERAAALGYSMDAIANDPDFIRLHPNPRFQSILN